METSERDGQEQRAESRIPRVVVTEREREVVALIAQGLDTEDIAEELFISRDVVKQKIRTIRAKIGGATMIELPDRLEAFDSASA